VYLDTPQTKIHYDLTNNLCNTKVLNVKIDDDYNKIDIIFSNMNNYRRMSPFER